VVTQLPINMYVDDSDTPSDILDALILAAFTTGAQPFARTVRLAKVLAEAPLRPQTGQLQRVATDGDTRSHIVSGDGWTLRATRWQGNSASLTVTATSDELAKEILREATEKALDTSEDPQDNAVTMGFWHVAPDRGPMRHNRRITAPSWEEVRGNYSGAVATALERLMAFDPESLNGRLLLLHGAPGTGKTTALRTLARAWSKWCQVDCVLDPERLFQEPGYLLQVAMDAHEENETKWRLLLIEDCDELISAEAKQASGQALSRLLNLTDGMLAQGRKILIGLTTNERISRLHPAVIRPGRCLAQIEVGPLGPAEAERWLGHPIGREATLAELYALKSGNPRLSRVPPQPPTGLYL
jgi:type II secretory pathway predicted ATPase ExeA